MTEALANKIAENFMTTMNPDRWDGRKEMPESVNTKTYEDDNEINIKGEKYHIEIVITTAQDNGTSKPILYVDLVNGEDSVAMCQTHTLNAPYIVALMISYVCKQKAKTA